MKKIGAVSAVALLLITGCSSDTEEPEPKTSTASASASSKTSASETLQSASEEEICQELLGTNSDGPLYETVFLITDPEKKTDGMATIATARRLNEEIQVLAEASPKLLRPLVRNVASPLEDIIGLTDQTRTTAEMDVEVWKQHTTNVLNLCAPSETNTGGNEPAPAAPATTKADEINALYPGYPLLVNVSSLDYRIANWFEGKLVDGQVVALAPGLYAPYNPNVPDLETYYESGGVAGDGAIKEAVLPNAGGATWSGVLPGPEEPQ